MNGAEAFAELISQLGEEPVVHANGYICRESFKKKDREENFYMIGSMGLASSIGLGVALARPELKTVIFDGDGNVLMAMGTLAMIAAAGPKNLVHVVIDNEVYESTGAQKSLSKEIHLEAIARAAGYPRVLKAERKEEVGPAFRRLLDSDGPGFLLIKADPAFDHVTGRVTHTPEEIKKRFMKALAAAPAV